MQYTRTDHADGSYTLHVTGLEIVPEEPSPERLAIADHLVDAGLMEEDDAYCWAADRLLPEEGSRRFDVELLYLDALDTLAEQSGDEELRYIADEQRRTLIEDLEELAELEREVGIIELVCDDSTGERWITVHPHGKGAVGPDGQDIKGQPVKIDGGGRVVAGMGEQNKGKTMGEIAEETEERNRLKRVKAGLEPPRPDDQDGGFVLHGGGAEKRGSSFGTEKPDSKDIEKEFPLPDPPEELKNSSKYSYDLQAMDSYKESVARALLARAEARGDIRHMTPDLDSLEKYAGRLAHDTAREIEARTGTRPYIQAEEVEQLCAELIIRKHPEFAETWGRRLELREAAYKEAVRKEKADKRRYAAERKKALAAWEQRADQAVQEAVSARPAPAGSPAERAAAAAQWRSSNPLAKDASMKDIQSLTERMRHTMPGTRCDSLQYGVDPRRAYDIARAQEILLDHFPALGCGIVNEIASNGGLVRQRQQEKTANALRQPELRREYMQNQANRKDAADAAGSCMDSLFERSLQIRDDVRHISCKYFLDLLCGGPGAAKMDALEKSHPDLYKYICETSYDDFAKGLREFSPEERNAIRSAISDQAASNFLKSRAKAYAERQAPAVDMPMLEFKSDNTYAWAYIEDFEAGGRTIKGGTVCLPDLYFTHEGKRSDLWDSKDGKKRFEGNGFHPAVKEGVSPCTALMVHEMAHCIDRALRDTAGVEYDRGDMLSDLIPEIDRMFIEESQAAMKKYHFATRNGKPNKRTSEYLGDKVRYALADRHEYVAESITEALTSPSPSANALKVLELYKKGYALWSRTPSSGT